MLEARLENLRYSVPITEIVSVVEFQPSSTTPTLISEEEEDLVPAHNTTEATFTAAAGATATRADDSSVAARVPLANRYKVRIVNTHANDRVYVARTQAGAQDTNAEVIEADYGVWEDFVDASVTVWVRPVGSNSISVRFIQYATA